METLVLAARLALIVALAGSAFFKLRALRTLPTQMQAFGIPGSLAVAAAILALGTVYWLVRDQDRRDLP